MAQQLGLALPVRPALGREAFFVAPCNALALAMLDGWERWDQGKLVLSGPRASGKTHLTHVWAIDTGAHIVSAMDLSKSNLEVLAQSPVAVENVDRIAPDYNAQTALFHLHNLMADTGVPLLMTGTASPNQWHMSLPDLQSRIDAAGHARLDTPDDTMLAAVLAKLFSDRQLIPRPDVIPYLTSRMERSFSAAQSIVATIDAASLAQKRALTRSFVRNVLDNHGDGDAGSPDD